MVGAADVSAAFAAMLASKDAHITLLEEIEQGRKAGALPTLAQSLRQAQLLAEHDRCVKAFTLALRQLQESDPGAARALIARLGTAATGAPADTGSG